MKLNTFEQHTTVKLSELGDDWDPRRINYEKMGLKSYMLINGEWIESKPTQSTYNKHIYATPEQIESLNADYLNFKQAKDKYYDHFKDLQQEKKRQWNPKF